MWDKTNATLPDSIFAEMWMLNNYLDLLQDDKLIIRWVLSILFYLNDPSRFLWIMFKLTLKASRHIQLNFSFVSATKIFVLCDRLKPETKQAKKERLRAMAEAKAEGKTKDPEPKKDGIVYGIKEVVSLVESKRAALVVIAHDVDPIEVIFLTYLNLVGPSLIWLACKKSKKDST